MSSGTRGGFRAIAGAVALLTACDPFEVVNPGPISDEDLALETAGKVVLVGIAGEVEVAVDGLAYYGGVASTDLRADATQPWVQNMSDGRLLPEDGQYGWDPIARAVWAGDHGVERLMQTQPNPQSSPLVAAAHLWAGFASRVAGDHLCVAIFDGGPPLAVNEYYLNAVRHFDQAYTMAQTIGATVDSIRLAALAGLAQSHLILGNFSLAAGFAGQVPDNFRWMAHRSLSSTREYNTVFELTNIHQATVWSTYSDTVGQGADPRIPFEKTTGMGSSGTKPFYFQLKSKRDTDIALAKGAEMRLIEAEVELRNNQVSNAMSIINTVRTNAGVGQVTATTAAEAWVALDRERHLVLWLEARRFKDNQRLGVTGLSLFSTSFVQGRNTCFPPSTAEEESNENLRGG
jgi:hypothetical protein